MKFHVKILSTTEVIQKNVLGGGGGWGEGSFYSPLPMKNRVNLAEGS